MILFLNKKENMKTQKSRRCEANGEICECENMSEMPENACGLVIFVVI